jgi:MYXO-CTERM domain-containing protein
VTDNTDCDDTNSNRYPSNTETVGNNVDNDCNGQEICYLDNDNDDARSVSTITSTTNTNCADAGEAVSGAPLDCNDSNSNMFPGNTEIPGNEIDNDCNGQEICYLDNDNDGYRPNPSATVVSPNPSCGDSGEAVSSDPTTDCNDNNFNVHPLATENVNDNLDANCDGYEVCYLDNDNDGYRPNISATKLSPNLLCAGSGDAIASDPTTDCNDSDNTIHPGATEDVGDEIDSDCDGGEICYVDQDLDGHAAETLDTTVSADTDCNETGEASASYSTDDCNDNNDAVNPTESEVCDGIDNDCSGSADDGISCGGGSADAGADAGIDGGSVGGGSGGTAGSTGGGTPDSGISASGSPAILDSGTSSGGSGLDAASANAGTTGNPGDTDGSTSPGAMQPGNGSLDGGNSGNGSAGTGPTGNGVDNDSDSGVEAAAGTDDSSGCSCRVVGGTAASPTSIKWLALLAVAFVRRRTVGRR